MDFELPEEHQLAYESALAFALSEIAPHNTEIERSDEFPPGSGNAWPSKATPALLSRRSTAAAAGIS